MQTIVGDCQERLRLQDGSIDRALAIHVLEHLPDLPSAVAELHRVLNPWGAFPSVMPCEGGLALGLARRISAQRIFERRYNVSYDWFVRSEHINFPTEIISELTKHFVPLEQRFFPLRMPITTLNLDDRPHDEPSRLTFRSASTNTLETALSLRRLLLSP